MAPDIIKLKEIKPELTEYVREAQLLLKKSPVPGDDDVHDLRVLMKKARSALKLIGPQIDMDFADKDIASLKEAAAVTTSWRDTSVHRKTLKELRKDYPDLFEQLHENEMIASLIKKPVLAPEPSPELVSAIQKIDELLKNTGFRIRFHKIGSTDPYLLLKEFERTYLRATEAFIKCRNNPKAGKLHEFRKKSKDFLYQLYFFKPVNPGSIKNLSKRLDEMTRDLGKLNDLAQLVEAINYKYPSETPALDELVVRVREKQDKHLKKVWPVAATIFMPGKKLVNVLGFKMLVV